jgi:hypothetical protein
LLEEGRVVKRIFCCLAIGAGLLTGTSASASAPDDGDPVLASFTEWMASTAGTEEDMSDLAYAACVVNEDRSAFCYALSRDGYPLGFWSPDPTAGNWIWSSYRPIANEDRLRPSDDMTAVDYLRSWASPLLESVHIAPRDYDAPSTQLENYIIDWDPEPADSGDGWVRVQGFAEAIGCDLPTEPPTLATELDC